MPFIKGQSGNPSGLRQKPTSAPDSDDELFVIRRRLLKIVKSRKSADNAAVAAGKELLDRLEGKVAARKDLGEQMSDSTARRVCELTERLLLRHTVTPPDQPTDSTPLSTTA